MKTKDIKPGVVYGYRRGKYGRPIPIVFLAVPNAEHLYSPDDRRAKGAPLFHHCPRAGKPRMGRGFSGADVGYPVAFVRTDGTDLTQPLRVTLDDFVAATKTYDEDRDVEYRVLTNPAHIVGPYEEAIAEDERRRTLRGQQAVLESERRATARVRASRLVGALKAYGVRAHAESSYEPTALEISLGDVEKLLALLPAPLSGED
jgi:hypothetical protein